MHMLDTWEQTAVFNPADPTQKKIEKYAGVPGAYASFYFNRVRTPGELKGPFTSGIATGAGITVGLLIASLAIGAGAMVVRRVRGKKGSKATAGLGFWPFKRRRARR